MATAAQPVKVVFVLGTQRGGTTILGRVLGQLDGVTFAGEVHRFWEFGVGSDRRCGCGLGIDVCPVWSAVLSRVREAGIDPHDVRRWKQEIAPARRSARGGPRAVARARRARPGAYDGYRAAMEATYQGLADAYATDTIVDSSKLPRFAALVGGLPSVELSVIDLVRDPRGVVASQLRRGDRASLARIRGIPPRVAAWAARHRRAAEVMASLPPSRRLVVRYEDLVSDPAGIANAAASMVGAPAVGWSDRSFDFPLVHTPRGPNPASSTTLVEDRSWRAELSAAESGLVTALAAPWLVRYGYHRRARPDAGRARPVG